MMVRDEVCGMEFEAVAAVSTLRFNGKTYYFCAERCKHLFAAHPERYVPVEPNASSN